MNVVGVRAAGVFPFRTHMTPNRPKLGYVEVTTEGACPLFEPGQAARGHVGHSAEILQERVVSHYFCLPSASLPAPDTLTISDHSVPQSVLAQKACTAHFHSSSSWQL